MRYKFSHAGVDDEGRKVYHWYSNRLPGDSRSEHVSCRADLFWNVPGEENR